MVSDESADEAGRPRGLFGRRDREYLLGELDVEPRTQRDREIRSDIRERMWHGMLDMILLYEHVERRDIEQALKDINVSKRLSRDRAIVHAVALFLDLGSGNELADASDFEQYVESAVQLTWRARGESVDDSTVWLGEPDVDLTIHFPERIDKERLANKVVTIWTRLTHLDREEPEGEENADIGDSLGLDSLSGDEVLYLISEVMTIQNGDKDIPEVADDNPDVEVLWEVARVWLAWRQNTPGNFSDPVQELEPDVIQAINQEDDLGDTIYF